MIRLYCCIAFWTLYSPLAALVGFSALYATGSVDVLWKLSLWGATAGYSLFGVRVRSIGDERLEDGRAYLFMSNHVSNLDPPIITRLIGRRISIMTKKELFRIPLFGKAMSAAGFVPVDRANGRAAVGSVLAAVRVLQSGMGMLVFPEGTRSPNGKLLPFKKGPFHLAMDAGILVVPITITGSYEAWPKGRASLRPGEVVVNFHPPIDPRQFARKEQLLVAVRDVIHSGLPRQYQDFPAGNSTMGDSTTVEPAAQ